MEENQTPNNSGPTQNLDANSRIIQPPTSGEGINAPRPEPPKHETYSSPPTAAPVPAVSVSTTPAQTVTPAAPSHPPVATAPQTQPQQTQTVSPVPAYATDTAPDTAPPKIQRDYVPGGVYVIAAVMMAPAVYIAYYSTLILITVGFGTMSVFLKMLMLKTPSMENPMIPILLMIAAGVVGGVMLFKQKQMGRIIAIVLAGIVLIYGMYLVINYMAAAASETTMSSLSGSYGGAYLFSVISTYILPPAIIILYLVRKKVRDFVSY